MTYNKALKLWTQQAAPLSLALCFTNVQAQSLTGLGA